MRTRKVKYNPKAYRLYDYNKMYIQSDGTVSTSREDAIEFEREYDNCNMEEDD